MTLLRYSLQFFSPPREATNISYDGSKQGKTLGVLVLFQSALNLNSFNFLETLKGSKHGHPHFFGGCRSDLLPNAGSSVKHPSFFMDVLLTRNQQCSCNYLTHSNHSHHKHTKTRNCQNTQFSLFDYKV